MANMIRINMVALINGSKRLPKLIILIEQRPLVDMDTKGHGYKTWRTWIQKHKASDTLQSVVCWVTHGEQHDGNGQRHRRQHSQTHQQKHRVKLVDLCEGVKQLCLDMIYTQTDRECIMCDDGGALKLCMRRVCVTYHKTSDSRTERRAGTSPAWPGWTGLIPSASSSESGWGTRGVTWVNDNRNSFRKYMRRTG